MRKLAEIKSQILERAISWAGNTKKREIQSQCLQSYRNFRSQFVVGFVQVSKCKLHTSCIVKLQMERLFCDSCARFMLVHSCRSAGLINRISLGLSFEMNWNTQRTVLFVYRRRFINLISFWISVLNFSVWVQVPMRLHYKSCCLQRWQLKCINTSSVWMNWPVCLALPSSQIIRIINAIRLTVNRYKMVLFFFFHPPFSEFDSCAEAEFRSLCLNSLFSVCGIISRVFLLPFLLFIHLPMNRAAFRIFIWCSKAIIVRFLLIF